MSRQRAAKDTWAAAGHALDDHDALGLAELVHLTAETAWNGIDPLESRIGFRVPGSAAARFPVKEIYANSLSAGLLT